MNKSTINIENIIQLLKEKAEEKGYISFFEILQEMGELKNNGKFYSQIIEALEEENIDIRIDKVEKEEGLEKDNDIDEIDEEGNKFFISEDVENEEEKIESEDKEGLFEEIDGEEVGEKGLTVSELDIARNFILDVAERPLLTKEEEIFYAKKIEDLQKEASTLLFNSVICLVQIKSFYQDLKRERVQNRIEEFVVGMIAGSKVLAEQKEKGYGFNEVLKRKKKKVLKKDNEESDGELEDIEFLTTDENSEIQSADEIAQEQEIAMWLVGETLPLIEKAIVMNSRYGYDSEQYKEVSNKIRENFEQIRFGTKCVDQMINVILDGRSQMQRILKEVEDIFEISGGQDYVNLFNASLANFYTDKKWIDGIFEKINGFSNVENKSFNKGLLSNKKKILSLQEKFIHLKNYHGMPIEDFLHLANKLENLKAGIKKSRDVMVNSNLKLVISIAKKFPTKGMEYLDLIQEGTFGLFKAVDRFNFRLGYKFSTYATWWIRQAISTGLTGLARLVRIPAHQVKLLAAINKEIEKLEREGKVYNEYTLSKKLGGNVKPEDIASLILISRDLYSLDTPVDDEQDSIDLSYQVDESWQETEVLEKAVEDSDLNKAVYESLSKELSDKEVKVICMTFGIGEEYPIDLDEVALKLEVSKERVRQIYLKAMEKLYASESIKEIVKDWDFDINVQKLPIASTRGAKRKREYGKKVGQSVLVLRLKKHIDGQAEDETIFIPIVEALNDYL